MGEARKRPQQALCASLKANVWFQRLTEGLDRHTFQRAIEGRAWVPAVDPKGVEAKNLSGSPNWELNGAHSSAGFHVPRPGSGNPQHSSDGGQKWRRDLPPLVWPVATTTIPSLQEGQLPRLTSST